MEWGWGHLICTDILGFLCIQFMSTTLLLECIVCVSFVVTAPVWWSLPVFTQCVLPPFSLRRSATYIDT